MKKTWFYKLLFSYLPVFLIMISFLIVIFIFSLGEVSLNAVSTVNKGTATHVLELVDNTLQSVEEIVIKELMETNGIRNYFNPFYDDERFQQMVIPSRGLGDIVNSHTLIHSLYMVRWKDKQVLTNNAAIPLSQFADSEFVYMYKNDNLGKKWTSSRQYLEFPSQNPIDVVSLVKTYPLPAGNEGILVINISIHSLKNLITHIMATNLINTELVNQEGVTIISSFPVAKHAKESMVEYSSNYTDWSIRSYIVNNDFYQFASNMNIVLLVTGISAIIIAIIYITYISKRHYRPLEAITTRMKGYAEVKSKQLLKGRGQDEFSFIESVLDSIITQTDDLSNQQKSHLITRRRQWVKETLDGEFINVEQSEWYQISKLLNWPVEISHFTTLVIEIDKFIEFRDMYSKRDQSLLKYLIANVTIEMMQHKALLIYGEWIQPNRWCACIHINDDSSKEDILITTEKIISWIQSNVDFKVTIGLGAIVHTSEEISHSYESAIYALQYKSVLGNDGVIAHWSIPYNEKNETRLQISNIRAIVHRYKLGDSSWEKMFDHYITELSGYIITGTELKYHLDYLIYQITDELRELNSDYQQIWFEEALPNLSKHLKSLDTLDELSLEVKRTLQELSKKMQDIRESRTSSNVMKGVREYVFAHYANPDLSLNLLSDEFSLSPKMVSHLFKEEFGEKFVDYLTNLRIEKAKQLIIDSNKTIQEIGEAVGYIHSFSFIRVFKKVTGVTPGDFRKQL